MLDSDFYLDLHQFVCSHKYQPTKYEDQDLCIIVVKGPNSLRT